MVINSSNFREGLFSRNATTFLPLPNSTSRPQKKRETVRDGQATTNIDRIQRGKQVSWYALPPGLIFECFFLLTQKIILHCGS